MSGFKQVLSAVERRYDYLSARSLVKEALANAGVEKKAKFEPKELKAVVEALGQLGTEMGRVWEALEMAPRGVKLATPSAPEPAAPAEEAAEAAAPEAPATEEPDAEEPDASEKPAARRKAGKKKA